MKELHDALIEFRDTVWEVLRLPQILRWLNRILGRKSQYGRRVFNPDTGEWEDTGERWPEDDPCDPDEFT